MLLLPYYQILCLLTLRISNSKILIASCNWLSIHYMSFNIICIYLYLQLCCPNSLTFCMVTCVLFSLEIKKARKSVSFQTAWTVEGLVLSKHRIIWVSKSEIIDIKLRSSQQQTSLQPSRHYHWVHARLLNYSFNAIPKTLFTTTKRAQWSCFSYYLLFIALAPCNFDWQN